jgi:N-methylhydantoinase B
VRIGERSIQELGREVGWDTLAQYAEDWFDYSEQRMIEAIARLPSGTVVAHSAHDPFPGVPDGIPTKVTLTVDAENARIMVDLRDNPDCQPCGLNLTQGTATTAAMVGIYNGIIDHTVPPNAGSFRRVDILVRENCCCGIPKHPYSCSVATTNLADRVSGPVQTAMAELADGFGMAETGPIIPAGMGVISGEDPRHGNAPFVNQIFLACTGGAGTPISDGFLSIIHAGNAGMCRHDSIEVDELHHPLFVSHRFLVPDTEGAGRYRGAPSGYTEFGPVDGCSMQVLYTSDGTINPAKGTRGGQAGSRARAQKRELDGSLTELPGCHGVTLEPGERIASYSAGGGGYGPPEERDPARVKHDLDEGWITARRAEEVYGLVLDATGAIDDAASRARRAALRNN